MLPGATRGISLWYALLVNASAGRLVLASTARRITPPAFVGITSASGSSRSSNRSVSSSSGSLRAKGTFPPPRTERFSSPFLPFSSKVQRSPQESSERLRLSSAPQQQQINARSTAANRRGWAQPMSSSSVAGLDEALPSSPPCVASSPTTDSSSSCEEEEVALAVARGGGGGGGGGVDLDAVMKVTLLSGFLGAGKTTLMQNVLRQARQERLSLAVIVNDMADVNVDAQLLARDEGQAQPGEWEGGARGLLGADIRSGGSEEQQRSSGAGGGGALVAMQGGCICCTLRDDLLMEVEAMAREGKYEHLIIESTGISDPTPVAEALATSASSSSSNGGDGFSAESGVSEGDGDDINVKASAEGESGEGGGGLGGRVEVVVEIAGTGTAAEGGGGGGGGEGLYAMDTLVTVVDSTSFLDEVRKADYIEERGLEAEEGDTRTIADLLVSQVEFANVILLNKADLVSEDDMATLEALVRRLNPVARVKRTVSSDVGLDDVLGTGEFDFEEASQAAGWLHALNDDPEDVTHTHSQNHGFNHHNGQDDGLNHGHDQGHTSDLDSGGQQAAAVTATTEGAAKSARRHGETFGIGSFTFRARKPFHPDRLMGFVMTHLPSVLRSKGFLWLATRHDKAGVWNQAGGSFATEYGGLWDDDYEPDHEDIGGEIKVDANANVKANINAEANATANADADANADARRNELVFIGLGMDESSLTSELRRCLLTEEEMAEGRAGWARMSDPFPPWEIDDGTYDDM